MILLDTHVALWLRAGDRRLGARARVEIDRAWQVQEVAVSAFSFWEMGTLRAKSRIEYPQDIGVWRLEQLRQGLVEIPVTGDIAIRANALLNFHPDPADRNHRCHRHDWPPARHCGPSDSRVVGDRSVSERRAVM